jgi:hypothetical protein
LRIKINHRIAAFKRFDFRTLWVEERQGDNPSLNKCRQGIMDEMFCVILVENESLQAGFEKAPEAVRRDFPALTTARRLKRYSVLSNREGLFIPHGSSLSLSEWGNT